jgi:hypothetical protein
MDPGRENQDERDEQGDGADRPAMSGTPRSLLDATRYTRNGSRFTRPRYVPTTDGAAASPATAKYTTASPRDRTMT